MWNLLLASVVSASAPEFEVRALDGQSAVGQLIELSAERVVVQTGGGPAAFPLGALASLAPKAAAVTEKTRAGVVIELVDQSRLAASGYQVTKGTAQITLDDGTKIDVPTGAIRSVRFQGETPPSERLAGQWSEIAAIQAAGDLLVVRKGDALDYLEGALSDVDAENAKFELDKELIPVKRAKVEGLFYYHAAADEMPRSQCVVTDKRSGSQWQVKTMSLQTAALRIATPAGLQIDLPLEAVAGVDFSQGNVQYLSDLTPESVTYTPLFGAKDKLALLDEYYQPKRDVGFERQPLMLDGKTYRKGLCLQSRTVAVYRLPGKARRFQATVGIDDSAGELGNVRAQIKADGKMLWEASVRGGDSPQTLDLDIAGVKRLEITVDFGEGGDVADRLDLCEARLTK